MPIGNGDLAANVWVEPGGDLLILLAKCDAWDENSTLLKLGRLRLKCSPALQTNRSFCQRLRVRHATIEIDIDTCAIRIHIDANRPVLCVAIDDDVERSVSVDLEIWRTEPRQVKTQTGDLFRSLDGRDPFPTICRPDDVLDDPNRIVWCHHNRAADPDPFDVNLRLQGLGAATQFMQHPLRGRTFGASVFGSGFARTSPTRIESSAAKSHRIKVVALTQHPATIEQWQASIARLADEISAEDATSARSKHEAWWGGFWRRSWIDVRSSEDASTFDLTRGYTLQRFMNACAGRSGPIKFNGSLFSVGKADDPDFRRWGGPGFWFMNSRLIYWPMLAAGDFDLLETWFRMYADQLPLQTLRTRTYYGHAGAHYPETITWWGTEVSAHYGWTPFEKRERPEAECPYVTYYFSGGIELVLMLIEFVERTSDARFARRVLLPIADAVTAFYANHYPRLPDGTIRFEPAQSLETWHDATNPLPEIAGLDYTLSRLLECPADWLPSSLRDRCESLRKSLPPVPTAVVDEKKILLPAQRFDRKKNSENPELYAVFPYRLFGVGKPEIETANATFDRRLHSGHTCWSQDDIQLALLGRTAEARQWISKRAAPECHSQSRFPAFWDAFHDWNPDMDHGGVLQLAMQYMLMQCDGRAIRLLPAWPIDWDVDFKLHAPFETTIECSVRGGRIETLHVEPASREADVIVSPPFTR